MNDHESEAAADNGDEGGPLEQALTRWLERAERLLLALIALLLLAGAATVTVSVVHDFSQVHSRGATTAITEVLDQVLLALILLELFATVVITIRRGTIPLRTILLVGVVTSVRQIVVVGARLALTPDLSGSAFRRSQIEVGVSAGVAAVLTASAWLMNRDRSQDNEN